MTAFFPREGKNQITNRNAHPRFALPRLENAGMEDSQRKSVNP